MAVSRIVFCLYRFEDLALLTNRRIFQISEAQNPPDNTAEKANLGAYPYHVPRAVAPKSPSHLFRGRLWPILKNTTSFSNFSTLVRSQLALG